MEIEVQFKMKADGSYVAVGNRDRIYEITEGPHGTWMLTVMSFIHADVHETLKDCFASAASWEEEDEE
jgi:hypothetical protein